MQSADERRCCHHQKLKIEMLADDGDGPKVIDMHKRTSHTMLMMWSRYFRGNCDVSCCFWIFAEYNYSSSFCFHIVIAVLGSE
jgi:hypothetical protein